MNLLICLTSNDTNHIDWSRICYKLKLNSLNIGSDPLFTIVRVGCCPSQSRHLYVWLSCTTPVPQAQISTRKYILDGILDASVDRLNSWSYLPRISDSRGQPFGSRISVREVPCTGLPISSQSKLEYKPVVHWNSTRVVIIHHEASATCYWFGYMVIVALFHKRKLREQ